MICETCGEECTPYQEDIGVGFTGAWGIPDNNVDVRWFCDLCDSEL